MTPERKQLLERLLSERQARSRSNSEASPSSVGSPSERFQRVQKLLEQRRARRSNSGGGGSASLLSPESTVGALSEARYGGPSGLQLSPGSDRSDETPSCFDTPYCPRQPPLQYSLDRPEAAQPLRSQARAHAGLQIESPGDSWPFSHTAGTENSGQEQGDFQRVEEALAEERWPGRLHIGGDALDSMAQALMSPVTLHSEDGSAPQERPDAEDRWDADEMRVSATSDAGDANAEGQNQVYASLSGRQHAQQRHGGAASPDGASSDDGGRGREEGQERGWEGGRQAAEGKMDEGSRLIALLGGDPAGPIELDTALLYSPASTIASSQRTGADTLLGSKGAQPDATPGGTHQAGFLLPNAARWTIRAKHGGHGQLWSPGTAATDRRSMSAPRERRSPQATVPKEFRLSETSRKHSRAAAAQRILEERRRDMTFRPALLPPRPGSPALGSESSLSGEARIARLAKPRTQLWEKCAARKREEEGGELAQCTFVPKVGRGPASGPKATVAGLPAPTRLYAHHDSKYRQWERLRAERDEEELKDCTFVPKVNASAGTHTPLHRRLSELQRQRSERLARMRLAREAADADATFSPVVNDRSLRMALAKQIRELHDEVPASQRLSIARALPAPTPDAEAGFTFAPELNRMSERLLEDSAQLPGNFFERQRFFHDLKLRRLRVLQSEEDADCTFSPDTKGQSAVILAASARSADHVGQTTLEQAERLSVADKRRVEGARAGAAHDYYSQFPFQPAINERSRHLVKGGDRLCRLTSSERRRERREAMAAEAEARMEAECTFQPRLTSRQPPTGTGQENRDPGDKGGLLRRIAEHRAEREAALEQQRARREMAELADCTFRPTRVAAAAPPPPKDNVAVAGMEAFMANKQRARQLAAEQAQREEKAFILHPRDTHAPTVPQPFCLRTDLREKETEGRRLQLQAAMLAESMKECTFHPNTSEALNRQLLQAILASDDEQEDARSMCSV